MTHKHLHTIEYHGVCDCAQMHEHHHHQNCGCSDGEASEAVISVCGRESGHRKARYELDTAGDDDPPQQRLKIPFKIARIKEYSVCQTVSFI